MLKNRIQNEYGKCINSSWYYIIFEWLEVMVIYLPPEHNSISDQSKCWILFSYVLLHFLLWFIRELNEKKILCFMKNTRLEAFVLQPYLSFKHTLLSMYSTFYSQRLRCIVDERWIEAIQEQFHMHDTCLFWVGVCVCVRMFVCNSFFVRVKCTSCTECVMHASFSTI